LFAFCLPTRSRDATGDGFWVFFVCVSLRGYDGVGYGYVRMMTIFLSRWNEQRVKFWRFFLGMKVDFECWIDDGIWHKFKGSVNVFVFILKMMKFS
jgi:hypothetical protein